MDAGKVVRVGKVLFYVGKEVSDYLRNAELHYYSLLEPVSITVKGEGAGGVSWNNSILEIVSNGADEVTFNIQPFGAETHYWNGPSVVEDYDDGRIEASLVHDLIWEWGSEISRANGMTESELLTWSNKHLAVLWREYGKRKGCKSWAVRLKSWVAANVCNSWLSRVWKRIVGAITLCVISAGCNGCLSIPEWEVTGGDGVQYKEVQYDK